MKPLPLPVRVAAGLAVTAVDRARHLPEKLAGLPVTMVSQALQLSMRVQQQVTELAIKGDDALSTLRPAEESPEWATFDEDGPETNGSVRLSPFDTVDGDFDVATDDEPVPAGDPWSAEERAMLHELDNAAPAEEPDLEPEPEAVDEVDAGPAAMPDYASLSLPQVRARMVRLSVRHLNQVLAFERAHEDRPSFVNMLTRRVATLRSQR
jgi:hypothetical protein